MKLTKETAIKMLESTDESIRQFALDNYPELGKKKLPKTREELETVVGFRCETQGFIDGVCIGDTTHKNIRATKEQAEASIAMAQLSQLMKVYNDWREPDYSRATRKYVICFEDEEIKIDYFFTISKFLTFKTPEIRDEFLENFRELIEKAKPLL